MSIRRDRRASHEVLSPGGPCGQRGDHAPQRGGCDLRSGLLENLDLLFGVFELLEQSHDLERNLGDVPQTSNFLGRYRELVDPLQP